MADHQERARLAVGNRLREIRIEAGLSGRALAAQADFHYTKVSRVEHGTQSLSNDEIRMWTAICGVPDEAADLIAQMRAIDSAYREWRRQTRSGLRRIQEEAAVLYERTRLFRIHEHWVVPGLLQTEAYSMAIMSYRMRSLATLDDRQAANAVRMARQRVLREGDHRFVFLLAEQVLHSRVPSIEAMASQLDRLVEAMALPSVALGIIPATAGMGAHSQTAFWIYDDTLVQIETLSAGLDITRSDEIALYAAEFESMRLAAVFGHSAKALIANARQDLVKQSATP